MYDYSGENNVLLVTGENATAGIFATYPNPHLTILNGFFDQVSTCHLVTNPSLNQKTHTLQMRNGICWSDI